jgi:hypothetical protein
MGEKKAGFKLTGFLYCRFQRLETMQLKKLNEKEKKDEKEFWSNFGDIFNRCYFLY